MLGFVACRVTLKLCGVGAAERSWGGVKTIKDGHWVEDMEVANRYRNDCLAEATIMEKYKNLVFMDMNPKSGTNGKVFSVLADNMEFRRGRGAGGGWRVIVVCADDDVDEQTFTLEEAIVNIGSTPQEDGIRIYHSREEEDKEE